MINFMETLAEYKDDIHTLAKALDLSPSDISKLWYQVLAELNEGNISSLQVEEGGILDTIEKLSNIDSIDESSDTGEVSKLYEKIYNTIYEPAADGYWNESVQKAVRYFNESLLLTAFDDEIDDSGYILDDIKNADAGLSFTSAPYVHPDVNVDGKHYLEVRGADATLDALKKLANLQFTREQNPDNWIRLIMPMNSHHVEVEDLDRNFWVIAAVLAAMCSYLWDDDSPFANMINKLMDEITQLWENIAYLWLELAMATQGDGRIHVEVLPLPNDEYNNFRKFDNFTAGDKLIYNIIERIDYLVDLYPKQDLVIIPFIRDYNYQKNWYAKEIYPYIFFYNRGQREWKWNPLYGENNKRLAFVLGADEQTDMGYTLSDVIGAARENEYSYSYCAPFTDVESYEDDGRRLYGLLRIVPDIEVEVSGNGYKLTKFQFVVHDAATEMANCSTSIARVVGISNPVTIYGDDIPVVCETLQRKTELPAVPLTTIYVDQDKYYQGEVVSWYKKTMEPQFKDADFTVIKLGDFIPYNAGAYNDISDMANISSAMQYIPESPGSGVYDWATYGVGAMKYNVSAASKSGGGPAYSLKFLNYCQVDHDKNGSISGGSISKWLDGNEVTPAALVEMGRQRVKNLVKMGYLKQESGLYVTKIGITFWTGDDGPQWSSGLVCNLIYYNYDENEAYNMGWVGLCDGYWASYASGVFTTYNGNRWRQLNLHADSVSIKTVGDKKTFNMKGGLLVWYDHNIEIYSHHQTVDQRPRCTITLNEDQDEHLYLSWSDFRNPFNNTNKMTPYITKPADSNNIFGVTGQAINVNQQYGVLPWVSGSYDTTEMSMGTSRNWGSTIQT